MTEIFLIDTETTGLEGYPFDYVVDVGIVRVDFDSKEVSDVFSSIVGHDVRNWSEYTKSAWIFKNSDLSIEDVMLAPCVELIASQLRGILDGKSVTSYNTAFDFNKFLLHPPYLLDESVCKFARDPMVAATNVCSIPGIRGFKWPKLEEAYALICPEDPVGIRGKQDHRALSDARVAGHVVLGLYRMGAYDPEAVC